MLDAAAVAVFLLGLLGWYFALGGIVIVMREWAIYPDAGDAAIGMLVFGPAILGASVLLLLLSLPLAFRQRETRLPAWFRVLMVISPALGCLVGLAIIYRALGG